MRPISKRDLFDTFSSYRMLVGEDEDKVNTLSRLYAGKKSHLGHNPSSYSLNRS